MLWCIPLQFLTMVAVLPHSQVIEKLQMIEKVTASSTTPTSSGGNGDSARVDWRLTGTCSAAPVDVSITSIIEMNLVTGKILSHRWRRHLGQGRHNLHHSRAGLLNMRLSLSFASFYYGFLTYASICVFASFSWGL